MTPFEIIDQFRKGCSNVTDHSTENDLWTAEQCPECSCAALAAVARWVDDVRGLAGATLEAKIDADLADLEREKGTPWRSLAVAALAHQARQLEGRDLTIARLRDVPAELLASLDTWAGAMARAARMIELAGNSGPKAKQIADGNRTISDLLKRAARVLRAIQGAPSS